MKVKEVDRTANVAWSPAAQHPIYLATGTAAQQLDATFSTNASLDIHCLNLADSDLEMTTVGTIPSEHRFHKLAWGGYGMDNGSASGVLVGGADNGKLFIWNPAKVLEKEDPLIETLEKHTGGVAALDFNPFQNNLLASGASESEIYIWDLNKLDSPMTPGAKSQPPDDVTCVAWNYQVQHILSSTYSGRCVVWDLRKNEPIIKISDSMSRIKCKLVCWHPEVATQLCLASEDDHTPVIQLWDLRFATSPLKNLEGHQRGVLSMAWCPQDPDLLLSCGKDNRILCWNPNSQVQSGEIVYELPTSNQWSFDIQWCPRNPALISSCSFDGHVSVYSLMGGSKPSPNTSKIADSFPTDPFSQSSLQPQQQTEEAPVVVLKKPPKWLRCPVGASFAFGGQLITFEKEKAPAGQPQQQQQQQATRSVVRLSKVVTETELVNCSEQLEQAINSGQLQEFCEMKVSNSKSDVDESIWKFMKVHFEKEPRSKYLQLLGYDKNDVTKKVTEATGADINGVDDKPQGVDAGELAQKMAQLDTTSSGVGDEAPPLAEGELAFDKIAADKHESRSDSPMPLATNDDVDGLVTQALLTANFEAAVELCLHDDRMAEAILLAIAGGPELFARTQKRYFQSSKNNLSRLVSSVVTRDFEHIVRTCDLDNWKEALAVALTYAKAEEFSMLCEVLGSRLESERHGELASSACLCYICAGNVDRLVECWNQHMGNSSTPAALQDLVEKVMILRKAVETAQGHAKEIRSGMIAEKLSKYAEMLASQGSLQTAINYLGESQEPQLTMLRDRLTEALTGRSVSKPFKVVNVQGDRPKQEAPVVQQQQPQQQVPARQQQQYQAQQQPRQRTTSGGYHQALAGSALHTSTTGSFSPYNQQPGYGGYTGPGASQPAYNQTPPFSPPASSASGPTVVAKGPLAQKYPATSAYSGSLYNPQEYQPTQPSPYGNLNQLQDHSGGYGEPHQAAAAPNMYNPAVSQTPGAPPQIGGSSSSGISYQEERPTGPWNDPPPVREKKAQQNNYTKQTPISTPLYGAPQYEETPPGAPDYGYLYNPQDYQQQMQQQQQQQQQEQQAAATAAAQKPKPEPVVKSPIPVDHQVLQDIFDGLTKQCLSASANPQMKRKLEDVLRKLEALYDKLRGNSLSPSLVLGLHQIVQAIQQYDYNTGLAYYTQMISQGNFSEISSFMPGIKMLMQIAAQMQVYVQQ